MGLEFIDIFNEWANDYDNAVFGENEEYKEVFEHYEDILETVANKSKGVVIEFGVGTGNLTQKLLERGLTVYGVEPSKAMRDKVNEKFQQLSIYEGDFLHIPDVIANIDTIVSTYAFHHLTDEEKMKAIEQFAALLPKNGKIVFADTAFESTKAKNEILNQAKMRGYFNLLEDLNREYYTFTYLLKEMFVKHDFSIQFSKLNKYVWLIEATKK